MSLLTAIQDAMLLCGLTKPTAVLSSSDTAIQQFVAFAQQEVDETYTGNNWRNSHINLTITGDGTSTLWPLPNDFERMLSGSAFWSQKYPSIPLQGPISDTDYLALMALPVMPVRPVWRLIGGILEIWPALSSGEIVNGGYFSTNPIASADGLTTYLRWTNDTDFPLFPETILRSGIIWRWKKSKGLDYAEDFRTWQMELEKKASHEKGAKIVRMTNTFNIGADQWPGIITVVSP